MPLRQGQPNLGDDHQEPRLEATAPPESPGEAGLQKALAEAEVGRVERLRRRQADEQLVAALRLHAFKGPEWDRFSEDLAAYGLSVLQLWIKKGEIFRVCRSKNLGRGGPPPHGRPLSANDATELACETVAKGIIQFRNVLVRDGWSSAGGANLRTFFIGQCLMQFGNVYRRWRKEELSPPWVWIVTLDEVHRQFDHREYGDPERTAIDRLHVELLLSLASDRERTVLELLREGWSHRQIGEVLGVTTKAVEDLVYRFRQKMRKKRGVGA
jgi:DNA-directed RNA polymerase specialized sigma24 family protein